MGTTYFKIFPIGFIKNKVKGNVELVIYEKYSEGLKGLEDFSHILVFYWFHLNDSRRERETLLVHPQKNLSKPLRGVFATRSSSRPNLIGIYCAKLLERKGNTLIIDEIDALEGTPIIDIKPYIKKLDCVPEATGEI